MTVAITISRLRLAPWLFLLAIAAACSAATPAAAQPASTKAAYNIDGKGLLLRGYDPVGYFKSGAPVKGRAEFSAVHQGATLHFASAANRDEFMQAPDKYLPAYGGFCAFGVASGYKVDGDPSVWKIVDGRLYLNINKSVGQKFGADPAGYIRNAERQWPQIKDKPR